MKPSAFVIVGRLLFGALAVVETVVGAWAEIWPRRFYDNFPGAGWHWIRAAGAYDEHLLRDFGGLSLALAVVTLAVALRPSTWSAITVAVAWEMYALPHLAYHLSHLDSLSMAQDVTNITSLALFAIAPVVSTLLVVRGAPRPADRC